MTDTFLSLSQSGNEPERLLHEEGAERLVGEVVETSLTSYFAQTYKLDDPPPFGGLVRVRDRNGRCEIFGTVYHIATGGLDPGRRAMVRGNGNLPTSDEQVYNDNPQLSRLLRTEFGVIVLGCRKIDRAGEFGRMNYIFPDYPPPLHYGVVLCDTATLLEFTGEPRYLRALLEAKEAPVEELTAAVLRHGTSARGADGREWLVENGRYLARLLKEDYDRLRLILEKCEI